MNIYKVISVFLLVVVFSSNTYAQSEDSFATDDSFRRETNIIVDQPVEDNTYFLAQKISVLKKISGTFWGIAQSIETGAEIKESFFGLAANIDIKENIGGDIFIIGRKVEIASEISGGGYIVGEDVQIDSDIGDDLNIIASRVILNGNVSDDVRIRAVEVYINANEIRGDLEINADRLYLTENVDIVGDFIVKDRILSNIKEYKSSDIPTSLDQLSTNAQDYLGFAKIKNIGYASYGLFSLLILLGDVLAAVVVFKLFPVKLNSALANLSFEKSQIKLNILNAAVFLFVSLLGLMLTAFSIIGLPLAFLIVLFIILAVQLSKYLGIYKIGRIVIEKIQPNLADNVFISALIGELVLLIIILLFALIPYIGDYLIAIFAIVYMLWTIGALVRVKFSSIRQIYLKR
jgi:hypothetical protein